MSSVAEFIDSPWTDEERAEFAAELTTLNLQRCKFAAVAGMMIVVWTTLLSLLVPELRFSDLRPWLLTCLGIYIILLTLRLAVVRPNASRRLRTAYVFTFVVVLIGICDGFFLVLSQQLTSVSSFSRGMLVTAVLFVLPPRRFLPIVAVNELLLCGWLFWRGINAGTLTAFLDGTAGAVVGSVGSWVLYAAKEKEFRQQRVIRRQHAEMAELMAITAHDLGSPLLGIKNLLTLAVQRAELDRTRLVAVIGEAIRGCERLLELVGGLLQAHAVEHPVVRLESGDLRAAVIAAAERNLPIAEAKGLRLDSCLPETDATAKFDENALAQVFDNLLGNALKFSATGARIEITLARVNSNWCVTIADEGPGIPEEERPRLFQKYARGTARPTGQETSTGLGLYIVKTLADQIGARVSYASREPRGSVFRVELAATD